MEIVATIHPMMEEMKIDNLVRELRKRKINHFRINFAKVEEKDFEEAVLKFAKLKKRYPDIKIMLDIPYPGKKIRIFNDKVKYIEKGKKYYITCEQHEMSDSSMYIYINEKLPKEIVRVGNILYYDLGQGAFVTNSIISDGLIEVVAKNSFDMLRSKSISGVVRGMEGDAGYVARICEKLDVDEVVLSFVEKATEISAISRYQREYGFRIISKIENAVGINNLEEIVDCSDAIMLGRGDMCIYSEYEKLLVYQNVLNSLCAEKGKNIYFATGYLESMEKNIIPTRSELIDLSVTVQYNPTGLVLNAAVVSSEKIDNVLSVIDRVEKCYQL